jgi:hypothetical protein
MAEDIFRIPTVSFRMTSSAFGLVLQNPGKRKEGLLIRLPLSMRTGGSSALENAAIVSISELVV